MASCPATLGTPIWGRPSKRLRSSRALRGSSTLQKDGCSDRSTIHLSHCSDTASNSCWAAVAGALCTSSQAPAQIRRSGRRQILPSKLSDGAASGSALSRSRSTLRLAAAAAAAEATAISANGKVTVPRSGPALLRHIAALMQKASKR